MKNIVKQTITAILFLALLVIFLIAESVMLVTVFMYDMYEKPIELELAIFLTIFFLVLFYLTTNGIEELVSEINRLIRLEEQESLEEEKEEE